MVCYFLGRDFANVLLGRATRKMGGCSFNRAGSFSVPPSFSSHAGFSSRGCSALQEWQGLFENISPCSSPCWMFPCQSSSRWHMSSGHIMVCQGSCVCSPCVCGADSSRQSFCAASSMTPNPSLCKQTLWFLRVVIPASDLLSNCLISPCFVDNHHHHHQAVDLIS